MSITFHFTTEEANALWDFFGGAAATFISEILKQNLSGGALAKFILEQGAKYGLGGLVFAGALTTLLATGMELAQALSVLGAAIHLMEKYLYGGHGIDMTMSILGTIVLPGTVDRQHSLWVGNQKICDCVMESLLGAVVRQLNEKSNP